MDLFSETDLSATWNVVEPIDRQIHNGLTRTRVDCDFSHSGCICPIAASKVIGYRCSASPVDIKPTISNFIYDLKKAGGNNVSIGSYFNLCKPAEELRLLRDRN